MCSKVPNPLTPTIHQKRAPLVTYPALHSEQPLLAPNTPNFGFLLEHFGHFLRHLWYRQGWQAGHKQSQSLRLTLSYNPQHCIANLAGILTTPDILTIAHFNHRIGVNIAISLLHLQHNYIAIMSPFVTISPLHSNIALTAARIVDFGNRLARSRIADSWPRATHLR